MIPPASITAWRAHAPWALDEQVEQDLVIQRALVEIFSVAELGNALAFRGGTALHKLYLTAAADRAQCVHVHRLDVACSSTQTAG